jgi:sortase A
MNWQRKTGVVLMVAGVLLLSVFAVPTVYGRAMAHLAVAQFRAESPSHSLWDAARIRAYQQSLGISMAPPEAVLRIPEAGIEVPVFEGTTDLALNRGVGHITGTAEPGQPGNIAITGHRDGFFRGLKDVAIGDRIEIQRPSPDGKTSSLTDTYLVQNMRIVLPQDMSVLAETHSKTLTLITCYPFYYIGAAPNRYVVQATLLSAAPAHS